MANKDVIGKPFLITSKEDYNEKYRMYNYYEIKRPPKELIDLFKDAQVANIDDCMNRMAAVNCVINPYNDSNVLGAAFTIKVPAGDNLMAHRPWTWQNRGML